MNRSHLNNTKILKIVHQDVIELLSDELSVDDLNKLKNYDFVGIIQSLYDAGTNPHYNYYAKIKRLLESPEIVKFALETAAYHYIPFMELVSSLDYKSLGFPNNIFDSVGLEHLFYKANNDVKQTECIECKRFRFDTFDAPNEFPKCNSCLQRGKEAKKKVDFTDYRFIGHTILSSTCNTARWKII